MPGSIKIEARNSFYLPYYKHEKRSLSSIMLLGTAAASSIPLADKSFWSYVGYICSYTTFWFALSWLINALSRRNSGTTAALLMGLWISQVLLIPGMIGLIARSAYPMPSRIELITRTREAVAKIARQNSDVLGRYLQDHPDLVKDTAGINPNDFAVKAFTAVLETERAVAPLERSFEVQRAGQQNVAARLTYLSPAIIMQPAMNAAARTGEDSFDSFKQYTDDFFKVNRDYFTKKIIGQRDFSSNVLEEIPKAEEDRQPGKSVSSFVVYFLILSLARILIGAIFFKRSKAL